MPTPCRLIIKKPSHVNFRGCGKINGLNRHWQGRSHSTDALPRVSDRCWALGYQIYG
ncbi:MAG: hypothetical protein AAFQ89_16090 [Cyanobacteria bacterium J06626_18]